MAKMTTHIIIQVPGSFCLVLLPIYTLAPSVTYESLSARRKTQWIAWPRVTKSDQDSRGRQLDSPLGKGVARSHCRRAGVVGDIV